MSSLSFAQIFITASCLIVGQNILADSHAVATVKELSNPSGPTWTMDMTAKDSGDTVTIKSQGLLGTEVLLDEQATSKKSDGSLIEYSVKHLQFSDEGTLKVTGNKGVLEYSENGAKQKTKEFKFSQPFVCPGNMEAFIRANFEELKKKGKIYVDFFVWERRDTVDFVIKYIGAEKVKTAAGEVEQNHIRMSVSNVFLSAVVDPIDVWFSQDMTQILRYKGRMAIKKKDPKSGELKGLDAEVIYTYK